MFRTLCLLLIVAAVLMGIYGYAKRPIVLVNGNFLTMDSANSEVTALGLQSDRIHAVGSQDDVVATIARLRSESSWRIRLFGTRFIDLQGRSVIPGFVDAHSHFPASGLVDIGMDLSSPPFGEVADIPTLLRHVTRHAQKLSDSRWIIGFNYDDAALNEQRHPSRTELDQAAPDHAVYLRHRSGHMGVANSRALQELGYEIEAVADSEKSVDNSLAGREQQLRLNGLLQEKAAPGMDRLLKEIPWWRLPGILFTARDDYLQAGITTLQNGYADRSTVRMLRYAARFGLVPQRIVVWPAHDKFDTEPGVSFSRPDALLNDATSGQRLARAIDWPLDDRRDVAIGAIKLIVDGSPQGRTAWLSEPYLHDDLLGDHYHGIANFEEGTLHRLILAYHRAGFQLALHGNGDAAIQSIIHGLQAAYLQYPRADARHIVVHAQTITLLQLQTLSRLDVSVSFFPTHTYYWGDWHRQRVLGEARAARISPLASADAAGVRYTIHADSPVTPVDPMQMLWSATKRLTSSGYLLGADERVSRLRALRAMTIDAAWQNHLENDRGSLEVGKLADFVVMSDDPLTIDDVRDITVQQVWIGGKRRL